MRDLKLTSFDILGESRRNSNGVTRKSGAPNRGGVVSKAIFDQYLAISQKRCNIET